MNRQSIWKIIFEFISIVFAVLLALGLNSYKQSLDLEKESKVLSDKIIQECQRNLNMLDSVIIQNNEFKNYLDSLKKQEKITGFSINFSSELLSSSAWNFTQASRSYPFMNEEFLNAATEVYELQNYHMDISNLMFQNIGEMMMRIDDLETRTLIQTSSYYLTNILNSSSQLQKAYQDFLKKHQVSNNPD